MRILNKIRLDVDLSNVGSDVEQEGEPADPGEELDSADFADLGRQALHGTVELDEERQNAAFLRWWVALQSRVSFLNAEARDADRDSQGENSNNAENLELGVSKEAEISG